MGYATEEDLLGAARAVGAYAAAQMGILTAILLLLERKGIVTAQEVESDVLNGLDRIVEQASRDLDPCNSGRPQAESELEALKVLVNNLRDKLFGGEDE